MTPVKTTDPFHKRLESMGDVSEGAFESWCNAHKIPFVRFGFNRPPFEYFQRLPTPLKFTPDYLIERGTKHYFVECKGTGRDLVVKLKRNSIEGMRMWNNFLPLMMFVFDSQKRNYAFVKYEDIPPLIEGLETLKFNDGSEYHAIPHDRLDWRKK